jgi:predicted NAD/FAD-binding protein
MLADVARFHRTGRRLLSDPPAPDYTLRHLLDDGGWSRAFVDWYLVPLCSSIWSADPSTFAEMPAATLLRFFDRHGMLSVGDKPAWRTVDGGAVTYVEAVLAPVRAAGRLRLSAPVDRLLRTDTGVEVTVAGRRPEPFDHVVVATHSDQALAMLADATRDEKEVLGDIAYQPNRVTLHTDARLMPRNRRAWAAWNYHRPAGGADRVTMTYHLNRLQGVEGNTPVLVTLNRDDEIDPARVLRSFDYSHPVIDAAAVAAQARHAEISGRDRISFAGAYWRSGFHEDGVQSALDVCRRLGVAW